MPTAEQMLGMSLDDIIKLNSKKSKPTGKKPETKGKTDQKPAAGRGGRGGRGGSQAGRGAGRGQAQQFNQPTARGNMGVKRGGVVKQQRGSLSNRTVLMKSPIIRTIPGAAAGRRPVQANPATQQPRLQQAQQQQYRPAPVPAGDQPWQRDMYREDNRPVRRIAEPARQPSGFKLKVKNLGFQVSEDDMKELFGSIGELISHKIRFDKSGRSMGEAQIVYKHKSDAQAAVQQYNGVLLDGNPMQIHMDDSIMTLPSGISVTRPYAGAGAGARSIRSRLMVDDTIMQE